MKTIVSLMAILAVGISIGAQGVRSKIPLVPCKLAIADAPSLRGFRLRQSLAELSVKFPKLIEAYKDAQAKDPLATLFGKAVISSHDLFPPGESVPPEFDDVVFTLIFMDESLMGFYVEYAVYTPDDVNEFIRHVGQTTKLNSASWTKTDAHNAEMKCRDFEAKLWDGFMPSFKGRIIYPAFGVYDRHALDEQNRRDAEFTAKKIRDAKEKERLERERIKTFRP